MQTNDKNNDANTTQREWHDLKPGDVIFFANGWFEVFDAYPVAKDTVLVKLAIRAAKAPTRIETYRVRVGDGKVTCRV